MAPNKILEFCGQLPKWGARLFLGYVYLSALFARIAFDGNCYIQASGSNPAFVGKTWEHLDSKYSRQGQEIPDNRKPAINHDPNLLYEGKKGNQGYVNFIKEPGIPQELIGNTAADPSPFDRKNHSENEIYHDAYLRLRTGYPEKLAQ